MRSTPTRRSDTPRCRNSTRSSCPTGDGSWAAKRNHRAWFIGVDEEGEDEDGEGEPAPAAPRVPLVDHLTPRVMAVVARVVSVAAAALRRAVASELPPAFTSWRGFEPGVLGLLAAVCVLAAIKPHVGALSAFAILGVSLTANGAYAPEILLFLGTVACRSLMRAGLMRLRAQPRPLGRSVSRRSRRLLRAASSSRLPSRRQRRRSPGFARLRSAVWERRA